MLLKSNTILSLLVFALFMAMPTDSFSQVKIDSALQKKINAMFKDDQKWRRELNKIQTGRTPAFDEATINRNMAMADSINGIAAKAIVKQYGFPGYDLVGESGSNGLWAVVQHCDDDIPFQQKVLLLMEKQVKRRNASGEDFALLQDRVLANEGKKQLYGTQIRIDAKTHKASPLPIQDSAAVDLRRKAVGLQPLNDYLKLFERH